MGAPLNQNTLTFSQSTRKAASTIPVLVENKINFLIEEVATIKSDVGALKTTATAIKTQTDKLTAIKTQTDKLTAIQTDVDTIKTNTTQPQS